MRFPALLFSILAPALVARADDYEARVFTGPDGARLNYRLLHPKNYDKTQKYPLVVFLHGAGERGDDNLAQLKHGALLFAKPEVRHEYPAFLFAPQCPKDQTWSAVKQWTQALPFEPEPKPVMQLVLTAIESLTREFSIDPDRLYVTGLSMGGYGTWDLLSRASDAIAAAVPVCGGGDATKIPDAKGVAIWAFHGMQDSTVPVARSRELIAALRSAGGTPLYSEYPYVKHDSWTNAYGEPELLQWMFAQRRGQIVPWEKCTVPFAQPPSSLFPGDGTIQSGLWFRALWREKREKWAADAGKDRGAIVFFGDSITQGWESLEQDFAGMKVANRGISGDTTRGLRYRVQGDVISLQPRAVSILIGTNDLDQGTEPQVVVENVKAIVGDLLTANPKFPIIINKVMPRLIEPGKFPEKIKLLNSLYERAFAGNPQITFCDTWSLFDRGNGECNVTEFPDMLHPNAAGYARWVGALKPIIDRVAK